MSEAGGPADRADPLPGDVIVELDGEPITGVDDLHRLLLEDRIGRRVTLAVVRGAEHVDLLVTPTEVRRGEPGPTANGGPRVAYRRAT